MPPPRGKWAPSPMWYGGTTSLTELPRDDGIRLSNAPLLPPTLALTKRCGCSASATRCSCSPRAPWPPLPSPRDTQPSESLDNQPIHASSAQMGKLRPAVPQAGSSCTWQLPPSGQLGMEGQLETAAGAAKIIGVHRPSGIHILGPPCLPPPLSLPLPGGTSDTGCRRSPAGSAGQCWACTG